MRWWEKGVKSTVAKPKDKACDRSSRNFSNNRRSLNSFLSNFKMFLYVNPRRNGFSDFATVIFFGSWVVIDVMGGFWFALTSGIGWLGWFIILLISNVWIGLVLYRKELMRFLIALHSSGWKESENREEIYKELAKYKKI